jgi:sugar/nucleoside kinase (ribokinase family)
MPELVRLCDVAVVNEEDAERVFGIKAPEAKVTAGTVEAEAYVRVCEALAKRFPNLKTGPSPCAARCRPATTSGVPSS